MGRGQLGHRVAARRARRRVDGRHARVLWYAGARDAGVAGAVLPRAVRQAAERRHQAAAAARDARPVCAARGRRVLRRDAAHGHPHGADHRVPVCVPGRGAERAARAVWPVPGGDVRDRGAVILLRGAPHPALWQRCRAAHRPAHVHPALCLVLVPVRPVARLAGRGAARAHVRRVVGGQHRLRRVDRAARARGVDAGPALGHPLGRGQWHRRARGRLCLRGVRRARVVPRLCRRRARHARAAVLLAVAQVARQKQQHAQHARRLDRRRLGRRAWSCRRRGRRDRAHHSGRAHRQARRTRRPRLVSAAAARRRHRRRRRRRRRRAELVPSTTMHHPWAFTAPSVWRVV
eukprot:Unigene11542_Nuclearia_a/m.35180 Unigene11542_Nuclearia_a/g.35180  ORF Unigene11542_Nuclearia_a/g.35180 Unigene11542_Nuclearia_a/m.35180 type:complete len:348 (+) Unigene11542_Nuclearia_a:533-1576(+)